VEEREDDVECKKWKNRVLNVFAIVHGLSEKIIFLLIYFLFK
jgi:hypothetical protein